MEQAASKAPNPDSPRPLGADSEPGLNKFFRAAIKMQASDLHLKVGQPPKLRILEHIKDTTGEVMTRERMEQLVFEILTPSQKEFFLKNGTVDFAHEIGAEDRFRVNVFRQRGLISIAARRVNTEILPFEGLNLPPILEKICDNKQGLVLAVGPTGCGKTTTVVAMMDYINRTRTCHIVTIEDPIEYLIKDKKAIVSQREIGIDMEDFDSALKYLMRQDPDVVCIAEMRDAKSIAAGMKAAETGHLVFGTMHSSNAAHAVQRLLDLFPANERDLARQSLSLTLKAIVAQVLLPSVKEGVGRIPAVEVLLANPSVRKLISEGREADLPTVIRSSKEEGMIDLTDSLVKLIMDGSIEPRESYKYAPNVDELKMALKGIRADTTGIL
ncbi:MAG: PilT/PilU family type 4a pilus ATPase [Sedimentisphaerales bacterium]|nr:PilT/PilU family type 4a pilus ATPase [Sedimentisphaerales bacterium]